MGHPEQTQPASADVVVIGAGLSGLQAARRLADQGLEVVVLEARDAVGGCAKTVEVNGHAFDVGGQWTGPGQPRMMAVWEGMGKIGRVPSLIEAHPGA
jgi:phytoene dehydrogenase-like protein